jgi:hypothetical protein
VVQLPFPILSRFCVDQWLGSTTCKRFGGKDFGQGNF